MNRTLVSSMAAFTLMIGSTIAFSGNAEAGIFGNRHCGGGLFSRLCAAKNRCAPTCCTPAPTCCAPAPSCCTPEPSCCAPAPSCCGQSVAAPVAQGCTSCGGGVVVDGGGSTMQSPMEASSEALDLAPGETLVPGSVTTSEAEAASEAADATAEPAAAAADAVESSSDAPPVPEVEADGVGSAAKEAAAKENTDI
ncbi:hypothetical protein [Novipirellula aureliae]|nr:hypothetical protein [Novipirellula aureliae]